MHCHQLRGNSLSLPRELRLPVWSKSEFHARCNLPLHLNVPIALYGSLCWWLYDSRVEKVFDFYSHLNNCIFSLTLTVHKKQEWVATEIIEEIYKIFGFSMGLLLGRWNEVCVHARYGLCRLLCPRLQLLQRWTNWPGLFAGVTGLWLMSLVWFLNSVNLPDWFLIHLSWQCSGSEAMCRAQYVLWSAHDLSSKLLEVMPDTAPLLFRFPIISHARRVVIQL